MHPRLRRQWSLFTLAVAAWLLVSPWVLGCGSDDTRVALNDVAAAVVLAALSLANLRLTRFLGHDDHRGCECRYWLPVDACKLGEQGSPGELRSRARDGRYASAREDVMQHPLFEPARHVQLRHLA